MFQQRDNWWDLICILDLPNMSGTIYSAEEKRKNEESHKNSGRMTPPPSGNNSKILPYDELLHYNIDNKFIKIIISGINVFLSEEWCKQQFYDYTNNIISLIYDINNNILQNNTILSEKQKKFVDGNSQRLHIIKNTTEFSELYAHPWVWCSSNDVNDLEQEINYISTCNTPLYNKHTNKTQDINTITTINPINPKVDNELNPTSPHSPIVKEQNKIKLLTPIWLNLYSYLRRLQYENNMNNIDEIQLFYQSFDLYLRTEITLQGLLILLPLSKGGILCIAMGLFHKSPLVKYYTMRILKRLQLYTSTKYAYDTLDAYFHEAYNRIYSKDIQGILHKEIVEYNSNNKDIRRGVVAGEEYILPNDIDNNDVFDPTTALSSLVSNTIALMSVEEDRYDVAFSETIDELDLLR